MGIHRAKMDALQPFAYIHEGIYRGEFGRACLLGASLRRLCFTPAPIGLLVHGSTAAGTLRKSYEV
jgi:hypothetical protein